MDATDPRRPASGEQNERAALREQLDGFIHDDDHWAGVGDRLWRLDARAAAVISVDTVWLAIEPLEMRASTEAALVRVVAVFGAARPHHAYVFANRRANRMKVLVHDGISVWLAARLLSRGRFVRPRDSDTMLSLTVRSSMPWHSGRLGSAPAKDQSPRYGDLYGD